ncbi:MAG: pitrilysin family protein [Candidatus Omnitrophota bacterium]
MYKRTDLDNGLRVVTHKMSGRQSLAIGIWINIGGRYEAFENKGIAHFLEHLLFKGTKKYSHRKIKESIEGIGGALNGFTSEELTCYLVKIPADYLEVSLNVLSDMVLNPVIPKGEVEKEKTVILEELKMYKDQPQSYVYDLLDELLWPNQPLGAPIIGSVESVSRVNKDALHSFRDSYYTPANIIISAAGTLDHNNLAGKALKIFRSQKKQNRNVFVKAKESQIIPQLKLFPKDTEQTHMALGFHALSREDPLKHALGMLHIILGANMSSRLFEEVREKRGLAYEIGTALKRFLDTGAFLVHAGIDNKKVIDSLELILAQLKKTKEELVSADELKRAKEFYLGQLRLALEDTLDNMLWIGESTASIDKTDTLEDVINEVNKVKREDLCKVANHVFQGRKLNLSLIGPLKDIEQDIYNKLKID